MSAEYLEADGRLDEYGFPIGGSFAAGARAERRSDSLTTFDFTNSLSAVARNVVTAKEEAPDPWPAAEWTEDVLSKPEGWPEGRKVWRQPEPDFSAWLVPPKPWRRRKAMRVCAGKDQRVRESPTERTHNGSIMRR